MTLTLDRPASGLSRRRSLSWGRGLDSRRGPDGGTGPAALTLPAAALLAACGAAHGPEPAVAPEPGRGPAAAVDAPEEFGAVDWGRDLDAALERSARTGRPVLLLFQEVPG